MAVELAFDPDYVNGCPTCEPEPFSEATYTGLWRPALDVTNNVISGPANGVLEEDRSMPPGVVGDVIERSGEKAGVAGLPGMKGSAFTPFVFNVALRRSGPKGTGFAVLIGTCTGTRRGVPGGTHRRSLPGLIRGETRPPVARNALWNRL